MLTEHADHDGRRKLAKQLMDPIPAATLRPPARTPSGAADSSGFMAAMHAAKGAP